MNSRKHTLAALIGIAAAFLLIVTAAHARIVPPREGWGAAYERAALEYWGGARPIACATFTVTWDSPVPEATNPEVAATGTQPTELGTACHIEVAPMTHEGIFIRCIVYGHEYGHTLGMGHVDEPHALMNPEAGADIFDPPCRALVARVHR